MSSTVNSIPGKIRVAIDIRDLRISKTGARTYLEEITKELKKGHASFEFFFIDTRLPVYGSKNFVLKAIEHLRFFFWKQAYLPILCKIKKIDTLFCSDYFVPFFRGRLQTVVVFHDAFFWEYPQQYNPLWLLLLNSIGVPAAKRADAVITMSNYAKEQIVKHIGFEKEKIHVIHLAAKSSTIPARQAKEVIITDKKYILHVGVMEKRKNLCNLIRAFNLLLKDGFSEYCLVLAGDKSLKNNIDDSSNILNLIKDLQLEDKILLPGFIEDEELASLYKRASLYAFSSVNEGFGIPILEAFQNELPVIAADNSSLPEVGGDALLYFNPYDVNDIKEKMKTVLENPAIRLDMIHKGKLRLSSFTWESNVKELLSVFKKTYEKKSNRNLQGF